MTHSFLLERFVFLFSPTKIPLDAKFILKAFTKSAVQPADGQELAEALRKDNALLRAEMGCLDARGNIPQHHGSEQSIMNVDV